MSNETTLDDVLALVAKWREPQAGDECTLYTMGKRENRNACAGELEALLPAIKAALEDARRLDELDRMLAEHGRLEITVNDASQVPDIRQVIDAAQEMSKWSYAAQSDL